MAENRHCARSPRISSAHPSGRSSTRSTCTLCPVALSNQSAASRALAAVGAPFTRTLPRTCRAGEHILESKRRTSRSGNAARTTSRTSAPTSLSSAPIPSASLPWPSSYSASLANPLPLYCLFTLNISYSLPYDSMYPAHLAAGVTAASR